MATDLERLVVQLSADIKTYENALNKAMGVTNKRARAIEQRFAKMNRTVAASYNHLATGAARAFALIGGVAGFRALSDSGTRITNSLKVAGLSGEKLEAVYQKLLKSAQDNAAPLETLVELYGRAAMVQGELGISSEQLIGFTNNIAVALRASGKSSAEASGALLQLSQALGAGIVRAEEFSSIQEGAPTILQAAAAGIKEAGGSVAKLRTIMLDGNLSSRAFFDGINAGAPVLEQKLASSVLTIDQRLENLKTALTDASRRFNESTAAAETFGREIDNLAAFVNNINFDNLITQIQSIIAQLNAGTAAVNNFMAAWGQKIGLSKLGEAAVGALPGDETMKSYFGGALTVYSGDAVKRRIDDAFADQIDNVGDLTADAIRNSVLGQGDVAAKGSKAARLPPEKKVEPISINDPQYKVTAQKSGGGGSKGKGRGGSRGNDYEREIEHIKERTAALQAETAAQATVNPLIDDYGFAAERAATAQDLLSAAKEAGVAAGKELSGVQQLLAGDFSNLSPKAREQAEAMLKLAGDMATATAESRKLEEQQDKIRESAEEWASLGKDVTKGFIQDLMDGKSAAEALTNALQKVADKLLNEVLDAIFQVNGAGGGGGGIFGNLLGSFFGGGSSAFPPAPAVGLFDKGGYTGAGGKHDPAGVVHKGEYVFDQDSVRAAGGPGALDEMRRRLRGYSAGGLVGAPAVPHVSLPRLNSSSGSLAGGAMKVDVGVSVDDDVNLKAYIKGISRQESTSAVRTGIDAFSKRQLPYRLQQINANPRKIG